MISIVDTPFGSLQQRLMTFLKFQNEYLGIFKLLHACIWHCEMSPSNSCLQNLSLKFGQCNSTLGGIHIVRTIIGGERWWSKLAWKPTWRERVGQFRTYFLESPKRAYYHTSRNQLEGLVIQLSCFATKRKVTMWAVELNRNGRAIQ